jgi:hypothetical protein
VCVALGMRGNAFQLVELLLQSGVTELGVVGRMLHMQ